MKKTQIIELFKNINRSKVSFISIMMFIILGISIYLGLGWTGDNLKYSLDKENVLGNGHDIEVFFPYGINDEDIAYLSEVEEIDEIEGYFCGYEDLYINDDSYVSKIVSINSKIDNPFNIEGRLPENDEEIVVEKGTAGTFKINIGDTLEFDGDESKTSYLINLLKIDEEEAIDKIDDIENLDTSYLKNKKFKVVGIAESMEYLSISGTAYGQTTFTNKQVAGIFFVNHSAFQEDCYGPYNYVAINSNDLRGLSIYSTEYKEKTDDFFRSIRNELDNLSALSYQRVRNGYAEIGDYIDEKLKDAKKQIEDGKIEIADSELDLQDYNIKLNDGKLELDNAKKELDKADKKLTNAEEEYENAAHLFSEYKRIYTKFNIAYPLLDEFDTELINDDLNTLYDKYNNDSDFKFAVDSFDVNDFKILAELINSSDFDIDNTELELLSLELKSNLIDLVRDDATLIKSLYDSNSNEYILAEYALMVVNSTALTDEVKLYLLASEYQDDKCILELLVEVYEETEILEFKIKSKLLFTKYTFKIVKNTGTDLVDKYIIDCQNKLANIRVQLDNGWREYGDGLYLYEKGLIEYEDSLAKYNQAIKDIEQAKIDLADGESKYEDGIRALNSYKDYDSSIKDCGSIVLTRQDNAATMYDELISDIISRIKATLGGLFLVIGFVVCYSVLTRMVFDQTKQIGTKKALGLTNTEIIFSYLAYTGICAIIGLTIGVLLAIFAVEPIIAPYATTTFTFNITGTFIDYKELAILCISEFVIVEVITYVSCVRLLNQNAIRLLQGNVAIDTKPRFYEKFGWFQRCSLLTKTIINNFFNDKRRILATMIGVAGCTALIVSSLTMRNNVLSCFDKQFKEYLKIESFIYFDKTNDNAKDNIYKVLDEEDVTCTPMERLFGYSNKSDYFSNIFTYVMVYDENDTNFMKLFSFKSSNGKQFKMGETWMSDSLKEYYKFDDDTIRFESVTGEKADIHVDGFYHYYYYSPMIFMSRTTYQEVFGTDSEDNIIVVNTRHLNEDELFETMKRVDGYVGYLNYRKHVEADAVVFTSIADAIVAIYTVAAILMALFVLLNLLITFVEEKKMELIVLMINGFSIKQARRYIYSDTILLTIIGVIIGVGIGTYAGDSAIKAFEGKYLYLIHQIDTTSCLIGAGITILLTFAISLIALSRISKFKLTDINKD